MIPAYTLTLLAALALVGAAPHPLRARQDATGMDATPSDSPNDDSWTLYTADEGTPAETDNTTVWDVGSDNSTAPGAWSTAAYSNATDEGLPWCDDEDGTPSLNLTASNSTAEEDCEDDEPAYDECDDEEGNYNSTAHTSPLPASGGTPAPAPAPATNATVTGPDFAKVNWTAFMQLDFTAIDWTTFDWASVYKTRIVIGSRSAVYIANNGTAYGNVTAHGHAHGHNGTNHSHLGHHNKTGGKHRGCEGHRSTAPLPVTSADVQSAAVSGTVTPPVPSQPATLGIEASASVSAPASASDSGASAAVSTAPSASATSPASTSPSAPAY